MSNTKEFKLADQYQTKFQNLDKISPLPPSSIKFQPAEQLEAQRLFYFHYLCLGALESDASSENKKIALKAIISEEKNTRKQDQLGIFHKNFVVDFFAQNANKNNTDFTSLIKEKGKALAGKINEHQASQDEKIFVTGRFVYSMYSDPKIVECARGIHDQVQSGRQR
jgi:hypothetical protein